MRTVGQESIAAVFGVAPKTIVEWQAAGFPVATRGGPGVPSEYETEDCINWLVAREVHKVQAESPRERLFRLQGDALERAEAVEKGVLVKTDAIEPRLRAAIVSAREFLLRRAAPLAAALEGCDRARREAVLRAAFDDFLRKLSNWRTAGADDEADA